jgi:thiol-disulfide isomerase/thioredoxin
MLAIVSAVVALVLTLVLGNVWPATASQCAPQVVRAQQVDAAALGNLAALTGTGTGRGYADLSFTDADGAAHRLSEFAGKSLLVNFWATWCVPCREEMPALNALAEGRNSDRFAVLTINLDIGEGGLDKARAFLADNQLSHLPLYADSSFSAFDRLKREGVAVGLPATVLLDEKGCELAILQGPAEWNSADGHAVVEALTGS